MTYTVNLSPLLPHLEDLPDWLVSHEKFDVVVAHGRFWAHNRAVVVSVQAIAMDVKAAPDGLAAALVDVRGERSEISQVIWRTDFDDDLCVAVRREDAVVVNGTVYDWDYVQMFRDLFPGLVLVAPPGCVSRDPKRIPPPGLVIVVNDVVVGAVGPLCREP